MDSLSIQRSVSIKNGQVLVNDQPFYSSEEVFFAPFAKALYKKLDCKYSKFYKMDALCKLGFLAAEIALHEKPNDLKDDEMALVFCNRSSSLNTDVKYQETIKDIPSPAVFVYTLPNIVIGEICIRHGFKGEAAFFVREKNEPSFLVNYVNVLFKETNTKQCLTGWLEMNVEGEYEAQIYLVSKEKGERPFIIDSIRQNIIE